MSGGGIIIQRAEHVIKALTHPSFLHFLHPHDQARARALAEAPVDAATHDDVTWAARKLHEVQGQSPFQAADSKAATEEASKSVT